MISHGNNCRRVVVAIATQQLRHRTPPTIALLTPPSCRAAIDSAATSMHSMPRSSFELSSRFFSSAAAPSDDSFDDDQLIGPTGSLFTNTSSATSNNSNASNNNMQSLVGQMGCITRTFDAQANVNATLVIGGPELAAHSSFDPDYSRAQSWIRHHAVGAAVLSPTLTVGLLQTLTEAAFPHAVCRSTSMQYYQPLIVGIPILARITVTSVAETTSLSLSDDDDDDTDSNSSKSRNSGADADGYCVTLATEVVRVRDQEIIAKGVEELFLLSP